MAIDKTIGIQPIVSMVPYVGSSATLLALARRKCGGESYPEVEDFLKYVSSEALVARWLSGQKQQTVNLPGFPVRRFESYPGH
jgi:hypothetical protein